VRGQEERERGKRDRLSNLVAAAVLQPMTAKERIIPRKPFKLITIARAARPMMGSMLYPKTEAVLQMSIPCSDFKSSKLITAVKVKQPKTLRP
jgi:hypothetical protein